MLFKWKGEGVQGMSLLPSPLPSPDLIRGRYRGRGGHAVSLTSLPAVHGQDLGRNTLYPSPLSSVDGLTHTGEIIIFPTYVVDYNCIFSNVLH